MIGLVVVLAAWMTYVEVEMPNRTNECPYDRWECPMTDEERKKLKEKESDEEGSYWDD